MNAVEVAQLLGAETEAEAKRDLTRVSGFAGAGADAIVFALDEAALQEALKSDAGLILASNSAVTTDVRVLRVKNPKYAFALCGRALTKGADEAFVHTTAVVHETARIGAGTRVGAGAVIEAGVVVGKTCSIGSNVTVCERARLGDRVVVQPGAVIGASGFGYVRDAENGSYLLFPQRGDTIIGDDVEIGANTTIDRGALGETSIGRGTKIDNQVHIGHNCVIGEDVMVAAQVGISGSCTVGDGAVLAGQVGLGDHVTIGPGVILGGASGVFPHKQVVGPGQMFMGVPAEPLREYLKAVAKLRRLK